MTKRCKICNIEYPATLEYFYGHPNGKNGLRSNCKDCHRNSQLDYLNNMTPEARYEMKKAEQQRNKHTYRQATRKQVALSRGVYHEDWTEKQLFDTYGTNCYICNKAIDFNAPKRGIGSEFSSWPDHIVPTSRGGENTIRNVRPCHRKCNQAKYTMTYDEFINSDRYDG
jgi:5-methylcytosine-specific restriction endonuclease McrA